MKAIRLYIGKITPMIISTVIGRHKSYLNRSSKGSADRSPFNQNPAFVKTYCDIDPDLRKLCTAWALIC